MKRTSNARVFESLSARDFAVLGSLERFRLLASAQLRRLHFEPTHSNLISAGRSTSRVMTRLEHDGLVARLSHRVGGMGGGSSGIVWQLSSGGDAALRWRSGRTARRRYVEPSRLFTRHTLAVAEVAIRLTEAERRGELEVVHLETEPTCWRRFMTPTGVAAWVKPDLYVVTAHGDFEEHTFVEVDLDSEHNPKLLSKAMAFQRYADSGIEHDERGVFPLVTWIVPDEPRRATLQAALTSEPRLDASLFHVATQDKIPAGLQPSETGQAEAS